MTVILLRVGDILFGLSTILLVFSNNHNKGFGNRIVYDITAVHATRDIS